MRTLLVIDDDRSVVQIVREAFHQTDIEVRAALTSDEGLRLLADEVPDVVLLDIMMPESSGLETFEKIRRVDAKLPIIFITAGGTSDTAIEAMKIGAYDYILKPLDLERLRTQVEQALETRRLMKVRVGLPDAAAEDQSEQLVGRSPEMLDVYKSVGRVASQNVTVLIVGESGTGKELIARAVYQHSTRSEGPFLAVNCAALPDTLLESELFGHEKGSFTGADRRRIGKFEQCQGGTIFLDEIGDMSPLVQGKVLRLLQQQEFERVGGNETIRTDVRIIAATNRDLEKLVAEERFRADLFFRLNGYTIRLPPLRQRGDDLLILTELFVGRFAREMNKEVHGVAPEAMKLLAEHPWPGNVRELQSVLKKAILQATGPMILPEFLPEELRGAARARPHPAAEPPASQLECLIDQRLRADATGLYAEALAAMESYLLTRVLRFTQGNQSKAAQILGITRGSLRNKIQALGISIGQVVQFDAAEDALSPG